MLDSVVGPGHAVVTTTAELDFDQTETKTETYTAGPGRAGRCRRASAGRPTTATAARAGGVLGPDNIQVPNGTTGGNGQYENSTTETATTRSDMVTETRKSRAGQRHAS